ncbi:hypothetical protein RRG08_001224 [Elysia crispata]|uniref:Uncharacterized protein n=1 Tax=Elysia crispata TaxID=231223 RepID=A0AAE1B8Y2_9GAST|nr:hypothetical protein RRG08_001224 [Elysia crispata]
MLPKTDTLKESGERRGMAWMISWTLLQNTAMTRNKRNNVCSRQLFLSFELCFLTFDALRSGILQDPSSELLPRSDQVPEDDSPSVLESSTGDDGYDTDLDPDLGLELLADERAKRCREDGAFAEYKQLRRRRKVVPNSFFMRHSLDEHLKIRHRYFSYGDSAVLSHEIQNQSSVTSLDIEDNFMGPAEMLCFAEMLKSNAYITEANYDPLLSGIEIGALI